MVKLTCLADGLGWPEGPTKLADGRIAFVETYRSRVSVLEADGTVASFAETGGGPNAALSGADGCVYVTQNGGVIGPWEADVKQPPSIQVVLPNGAVEILADEVDGHKLRAPNDLVFGPNGWLYFTDPGGAFDPVAKSNPGFICALRPDGSGVVLAELPPTYPNGIVVEASGDVVWVESYTCAVRRLSHGAITTLCTLPDGCIPDGLKIGQSGQLYITGCQSGTVEIVTREGAIAGSIAVGTVPTNCVFADGGLYVTDGGKPGLSPASNREGALWHCSGLEEDGQALFEGRIDMPSGPGC
ncbi:SMP-30/gluconolactonase/LRE family protein [Marinovum sp. 2_MG-2023]|uniref:SMP-30/gluconolactonase/LRE family protein n=1 Tax=unclassified Marinovum TaxID=2647166 RepID=UPI0026E15BC8|nr:MULTISPECIES: SMP-30/gluconolactonase/LRE family protein [unclassified Marinovum]MDO6729964.1 SMP-30/gluconolactonase/LRE family protein [Marinovum sp. 2_MG-2023]MDO6779778.1 SMP-30/gluconolactonase/LRE family protein [Marinovum sp. 1_MG-2023]